jgi:hypothetical protein
MKLKAETGGWGKLTVLTCSAERQTEPVLPVESLSL